MKKDKHPFTQKIQIYDKGAKVQNRFGGDSIELNALELSIYDTIIGLDSTLAQANATTSYVEHKNQNEEFHRGLDWFAKFNPKAYMVLLD